MTWENFFRGPGGGTDNQAAEALSVKLLTTKVPLMFVVMQYVMLCDSCGIRCLRIPVTWEELDLSVLKPLLSFCKFDESLDSARSMSDTSAGPSGIKFEKSVWG